MKEVLLKTNSNAVGLLLRVTAATVMFPHGAQKLLGWFSGFGFSGTMDYFTGTMNLPWIVAFLVIIIEFFVPFALLIGFATRLWAAVLAVLMLGIVVTSHWQYGFFMNWLGNQTGEGIEYFLLYIAIAAALMFTGSGKLSIDRIMVKEKNELQGGF